MSEDPTRMRVFEDAQPPAPDALADDDDDDGPSCRVVGPPDLDAERRSEALAPAPGWTACLMVVHTRSPHPRGKCFELVSPTHVGRRADCDVVIEEVLVSRTHARFERGRAGLGVVDLRSTNGTYLNNQRITDAALSHGDRVAIGSTFFKVLSEGDLAARYKDEMDQLAERDGLTGACNRRRFRDLLEIERSRRGSDGPGAVVLLDVDHLGRINAEAGAVAGDLALIEVTEIARSHLRPNDVVAHLGSGRFALLLTGAALGEAVEMAAAIRRTVAEHRFDYDGDAILITLSAGVTAIEPGDATPSDAVARAEARLAEAKRAGRDRISSRPAAPR